MTITLILHFLKLKFIHKKYYKRSPHYYQCYNIIEYLQERVKECSFEVIKLTNEELDSKD